MIKPVTIPVVDEDALMTYGRRGLASALSTEEAKNTRSNKNTILVVAPIFSLQDMQRCFGEPHIYKEQWYANVVNCTVGYMS